MAILVRKYDSVTGAEFVEEATDHTHAVVSATGSIEGDVEVAENVNLLVDVRMVDMRALFTTNLANITTITGPQTHEGISLAAGDTAAFMGQTTTSQNDYWTVGATGQTWTRATLRPRRGQRLHVREGVFANRQFVVTRSVDIGGGVGMLLRRIDGSLMCRVGTDANTGIVSNITYELMLPRLYIGIPALTQVRTYTLPAIANLVDGTEIILQFETNAPNAQVVIAPFNTGAGETINNATSYTMLASGYRRTHVIFRNGVWFANQFA